jgi:hypothetical protein
LKRSLFIPVLLFLIIGSGAAYEFYMPVSIQATISPSVLMPGDEAVMALVLENGAEASGAAVTTGAGGPGMSAPGISGPPSSTQSSTPINETRLKGSGTIRILTPDYKYVGMIGAGDKVLLYYKIKAEDNISGGTYLMDFSILGGYDTATITRQIPVKVDSATINIARAGASTKNAINLNVANPRENTLNAVTIIPSATGLIFSPDQYYIGTMDPDEVFTISFLVNSEIQGKSVKGPVNLTITSQFKNGDNWHNSGAFITGYDLPQDDSKQSSYLLPTSVAVLILLASGFYMYRRKKIRPAVPAPAGMHQNQPDLVRIK